MPGKTRLRNDLLCVEWDAKPYTLSHSRSERPCSLCVVNRLSFKPWSNWLLLTDVILRVCLLKGTLTTTFSTIFYHLFSSGDRILCSTFIRRHCKILQNKRCKTECFTFAVMLHLIIYAVALRYKLSTRYIATDLWPLGRLINPELCSGGRVRVQYIGQIRRDLQRIKNHQVSSLLHSGIAVLSNL